MDNFLTVVFCLSLYLWARPHQNYCIDMFTTDRYQAVEDTSILEVICVCLLFVVSSCQRLADIRNLISDCFYCWSLFDAIQTSTSSMSSSLYEKFLACGCKNIVLSGHCTCLTLWLHSAPYNTFIITTSTSNWFHSRSRNLVDVFRTSKKSKKMCETAEVQTQQEVPV